MKWSIKEFNELDGEEIYKILSLRNEIFIFYRSLGFKEISR